MDSSAGMQRRRYAWGVSPHPAFLVLAAFALTSLTACSSSSGELSTGCTGGSSSSIDIAVVDDTNESMNICDATVTAMNGGSTVTLAKTGGTSDCTYVGAVSSGGSYTLVATAPNYQMMTLILPVQAGCSYSSQIDVSPKP
jgi:hypothetical protein